MKLNLSKEWFERSIAMSEPLELDDADERIEAMKNIFAARLADVEARLEAAKLILWQFLRTKPSELPDLLGGVAEFLGESP